jgi:hypothetical protein
MVPVKKRRIVDRKVEKVKEVEEGKRKGGSLKKLIRLP